MLGVFISGLPEFENLYRTLRRMQVSGVFGQRVFVMSGRPPIESRIRQIVTKAGLNVVIQPGRLMKPPVCHRRKNAELELALCLGDPRSDHSNHDRRTLHIAQGSLPTVYLQQGVISEDITYPRSERNRPVALYSELIFPFEPQDQNRNIFVCGVTDRMRVDGVLQEVRPTAKTSASRLRKRLLLVYSFRWKGRYTIGDVDAFTEILIALATANRKIVAIVRGHRSKFRRAAAHHDALISRMESNVFLPTNTLAQ